jgi:hypothetical protein
MESVMRNEHIKLPAIAMIKPVILLDKSGAINDGT